MHALQTSNPWVSIITLADGIGKHDPAFKRNDKYLTGIEKSQKSILLWIF
jgi:hypothetical protein